MITFNENANTLQIVMDTPIGEQAEELFLDGSCQAAEFDGNSYVESTPWTDDGQLVTTSGAADGSSAVTVTSRWITSEGNMVQCTIHGCSTYHRTFALEPPSL